VRLAPVRSAGRASVKRSRFPTTALASRPSRRSSPKVSVGSGRLKSQDFYDATFDRSAASFENPDHVNIVIHNYRWRLGLAEGEAEYEELEERLAQAPSITVPTITLEGDANGAPHPEPSAYAAKFSDEYEHRTVEGSVGHNLPREAPDSFAQAVLDVVARESASRASEPSK
jgi:pimeloyl-ACP methyl ester carboxylesterase